MNNLKAFYLQNFWRDWTSFKGRLSRRGYAVANLLFGLTVVPVILATVGTAIDVFYFKEQPDTLFTLYTGIFSIIILVVMVMSLSIQIRRLHDLNYSGWLILLLMVPIINLFVGLTMICVRGNVGANKYGEPQLLEDTALKEPFAYDYHAVTLLNALPKYIMQNIFGSYFKDNLFTIKGRANRYEYFVKTAGLLIVYQVCTMLIDLISIWEDPSDMGLFVKLLLLAIAIVLGFMVDIRRGHDRGHNWYYSLLFLVPLVNLVHIAYQMSTPGCNTSNEYGECVSQLNENGVPMDDF